ncbi:MAG: hypothetical protein RIS75_980 [Actinomycetota bacterium]
MKMKFVLGSTALIGALVLSGCTVNIGSTDHMDGNNHMSSETTGTYDTAALMFASMMIPHHEQAVVMANMVLSKSSNPQLLDLAQKIKAAQQPEIAQMEGWLATEPDYDSTHMDHSTMQGMLSMAEIAALGELSGTAFDNAFLEGMIKHHEGAIVMAKMIADSSNSEVRKLGNAIIDAQTAEIELMKTLIK